MAVNAEALLALESSLASTMHASWDELYSALMSEVEGYIDAGDFGRAADMVTGINFSGVLEAVEKEARFISLSAVTYGTVFARKKKRGGSKDRKTPKERVDSTIENSLKVLSLVLADAAVDLQRQLYLYIDYHRVLADKVVKAETAFAKPFKSYANTVGRWKLDISSSLHTSKLGVWGFLVEADFQGLKTFKVNEVLDSRGCEVCARMHGRVFDVKTAIKKLDTWLSVEDVNTLRSLSKWPKTSKEGLAELDRMTPEELQRAGWDTPPYHPGCRGILVKMNEAIDVVGKVRGKPSPAFSTSAPLAQAAAYQIQSGLVTQASGLIAGGATMETVKDLLDLSDKDARLIESLLDV